MSTNNLARLCEEQTKRFPRSNSDSSIWHSPEWRLNIYKILSKYIKRFLLTTQCCWPLNAFNTQLITRIKICFILSTLPWKIQITTEEVHCIFANTNEITVNANMYFIWSKSCVQLPSFDGNCYEREWYCLPNIADWRLDTLKSSIYVTHFSIRNETSSWNLPASFNAILPSRVSRSIQYWMLFLHVYSI